MLLHRGGPAIRQSRIHETRLRPESARGRRPGAPFGSGADPVAVHL